MCQYRAVDYTEEIHRQEYISLFFASAAAENNHNVDI
jgi:hypothetical protein